MSSPPRGYSERDASPRPREGGRGPPPRGYDASSSRRRRPGGEPRRHSSSIERDRRRGRSRDRGPPHADFDDPHDRHHRRRLSSGPHRGGLLPRSRSREPPPQGRHSRRERRNRRRSHSKSYETDDERPRRGGGGDDLEEHLSARNSRRHRRKRRRRRPESHSPPSRRSVSYSEHDRPRAGVVSDDEEIVKRRDDSPRSVHDDTVGHFEGGRGTIIADRYRVISEVGVGTFGRVLECLDCERSRWNRNHERREKDEYCAIKIVRKVDRYYESAQIEARILRDVNRREGRGRTHCVILLDSFTFQGHFCMVFENLGPSLFDFLKRHNYQPFPMACVQDFTVQLLETLEFLHSFRLIHTDLKIENILLMNDREINFDRQRRVPERTRIKLIDFGGACYDDSKKSTVINTRQYRAPEVILATGWSMPSDMWSLGCILAELYQGELLFPTHSNLEHLALMERTIGPFPRRMFKNANELANKAFDASGRHRMERVLSAENATFVHKSPTLEEVVRHPDDRWFLRLLRQMLVLDPLGRATAHECLKYLGSVRRCHVRYA